MKIGVQEDVGLERKSTSGHIMLLVEYPAEVTVNYTFGMDVCDAMCHFQYLT